MKKKPYPKIKRMAGGIMPIPCPIESGKRFDWLVSIIKKRDYKIGAEVGSAGGKTTGTLLSSCPDLYLYAVDLWAPIPDAVGGGTQYKDWNFEKLRRRFDKAVNSFSDRVTVLRGISWSVAGKVEDESLDFVFIDADHEYESVLKDIQAWTPKLKSGGMMSGHDTHFEGVFAAINELIPNWKATGGVGESGWCIYYPYCFSFESDRISFTGFR